MLRFELLLEELAHVSQRDLVTRGDTSYLAYLSDLIFAALPGDLIVKFVQSCPIFVNRWKVGDHL